MVIGFLATVITVFLGGVIGIVGGFAGGKLDSVLMRITDFFLVLPTFVLALILAPIISDVIGSGSTVLGHPHDAHRDRHRGRHHELGVDGPDHSSASVVTEGASVRRPRSRHRRGPSAHRPAPHPSQRGESDRRQCGARIRRRRPDRDDACPSSALAIRSSRRGDSYSTPQRRSARRRSARGGTSSRPARASCSSCSPSRSSGRPSTTCSIPAGGTVDEPANPAFSTRRHHAAGRRDRGARGAGGHRFGRDHRRGRTKRGHHDRRPAPAAALAEARRSGRAAARRRGPQDVLLDGVGPGPGRRRRVVQARARRGTGHRRRIRVRQDHDRALAGPDPAGQREDRRRGASR